MYIYIYNHIYYRCIYYYVYVYIDIHVWYGKSKASADWEVRSILTHPPSKRAGTETGMEFNEQKVSLSGVYLDSWPKHFKHFMPALSVSMEKRLRQKHKSTQAHFLVPKC